MTLGGFTMIRNGNKLDFCWKECVSSLLPVCDVVSISLAESDDGTEEEARAWAKREPKLVLNVYPWNEPKGNPDWFVDWIQYARMHTPADWVIQLDADEVLHEKSYDELRKFIETPDRTGVVTRWNFWRDEKHIIPDGVCLGKRVVRVAPQPLWIASDGYHPKGEKAASMSVPTGIEIGHYGFIRKPKGYFAKERLIQNWFFATYDQRLEAVEHVPGREWMDSPGINDYHGNVDPFPSTHPVAIHEWLKERGMQP